VSTESVDYEVFIVGQGAAAFAAALYAARYQLRSIVVGEKFGGETAIGGVIENYPGYTEIDGFELMMKFREQADKYEVPIVDDKVVSLTQEAHCFEATTAEGNKYTSSVVILAVGRERRMLGLEHEEEWIGRGVSLCSTCDAPLFRGSVVAVAGGGNAAVEGAILLNRYAHQVYIVYRGQSFVRPEPVNVRRLDEAENVEQVMGTNVVQLKGEDGLTGVVLDRPYSGSSELELDGLFVEIGADPRNELARQVGAELNEQGEVKVDRLMRTNVHGLFAAGDLSDASGDLKQTITAAAQGARAAASAYSELAEHAEACKWHSKTLAA
jgi:thioredoxin reductase (NADPH)